jgi:hypothetical protein
MEKAHSHFKKFRISHQNKKLLQIKVLDGIHLERIGVVLVD